jgi:hypothetical protein
MKRFATGLLASLAVATSLVLAQEQAKPATADQQKTPPDVSVTGCLTQGSAPTVFILDNARMNPRDQNEKAKSFLLVAATEDLGFASHLNHQVSVTGIAEVKAPAMPPAGQKPTEKDLPKLTAKSLTQVADTCTPASR